MKKLFLIVLLLAGIYLVYKYAFQKEEPQQAPPKSLKVSTHSEPFNESMASVLNRYYNMSSAFVDWDSVAVNKAAAEVLQAINDFKIDELKTDSSIYETALFPIENSRNNLTSIMQSDNWEGKRRAFQDLSENLRMLLITIKYDQDIVYWQECPMAFGDNAIGNWLSAEEKVINPYLGTKDPKYGATMLHCGETKEKIDFSSTKMDL